MKLLPRLVLWLILSSLLAFGAKAQEVRTANTLICGSADHAKQFASQNQDLTQALATVNRAPNGETSCLVAPIAYVAGKQLDRVERREATYMVTEIVIVGVGTPYGLLAIEPAVVYTVLKLDEEAI
ncbi:MAG TPA: hypothetical protein VG095_03355 [Chthoniobacterales bacterium]|nr:hypothetical protein [Chthoniobacterales bacterium]